MVAFASLALVIAGSLPPECALGSRVHAALEAGATTDELTLLASEFHDTLRSGISIDGQSERSFLSAEARQFLATQIETQRARDGLPALRERVRTEGPRALVSSDERSRYRKQLDRVAEGAATEIEIRRSTAEALFAVNLIGDQLLELVDADSSVSEAIDEAMRRALDDQRYESVARRVCATAPPVASALGFPAATCSQLVESVVAASPDELAERWRRVAKGEVTRQRRAAMAALLLGLAIAVVLPPEIAVVRTSAGTAPRARRPSRDSSRGTLRRSRLAGQGAA